MHDFRPFFQDDVPKRQFWDLSSSRTWTSLVPLCQLSGWLDARVFDGQSKCALKSARTSLVLWNSEIRQGQSVVVLDFALLLTILYTTS